MTNNLIKPDFKKITKLLNEASNIDASLFSIIKDESRFTEDINSLTNDMRKEAIVNLLKEIDIDQVNADKIGIRVSLLKAAGIRNIFQVLNMPINRLTAIDGIGSQTAYKIKDAASKISSNVDKSVRLRIDPNDKNKNNLKLVSLLHFLIESKEIRNECRQLYDVNHTSLVNNIQFTKKIENQWKWFFSFKKTKEHSLTHLSELEITLSDDLKENVERLLSAYNSIKNEHDDLSWSEFSMNSAPYYAMLESIAGSKVDISITRGGLSEDLINKVEAYKLDLKFLKTTLRNYQTFGTKYVLHQRNTLLGDEMGLGKTVQSIAAMSDLKAKGKSKFIVVCPASVLINWIREIPQHSVLETYKMHGLDRDRMFNLWINNGGVAVTTYETISKLTLPTDLKIDLLIVDEAHYVKNPYAIRTKYLIDLTKCAERTCFMTGTPLENRVDEMQFLVKCLQPNIANIISDMRHISSAPQFREKIAPVYLRRIREDVLTELPDKLEKEEWCNFNEYEEREYRDAVLSGNFMAMRQLSWNVSDVNSSSKAQRLREICDDARNNNRKIIVFSFFRDVIDKVCNMFGERLCLQPITGSVTPQKRQDIIDEFSKSEAGTVLVCQVTAGGVGLNIQAASVVVFCEPQIKPSIENQAISRAYRMGQNQKVVVHRLLIEDTVDERIMSLLSMKQELFDNFAHESAVADEKKMSEKTWINSIIQDEQNKYRQKTN